jgi:hypothetical protein
MGLLAGRRWVAPKKQTIAVRMTIEIGLSGNPRLAGERLAQDKTFGFCN